MKKDKQVPGKKDADSVEKPGIVEVSHEESHIDGSRDIGFMIS